MAEQHTPGKWFIDRNPSGNPNRVVRSEKLIVCDMPWPAGDESDDRIQANSHLIAAAPELLEALKRVVAAERAFIEDTNAAWDDEVGQAVIAAEAAIAKAEGR